MARCGSVAGGLVVLLIGTMAVTQPPRGPGGGVRGPGFGGPAGLGLAGLLGIPEVRKELGTSEEQNKQIDDLSGELQEQLRASFGNLDFQQLQQLSEEERQKRFAESRKKSEEATQKADEKIGKVLDAKQLARLN